MATFRNLFSRSSLYEPSASRLPYSTEILGQHYLFRGWGKDRTSTSINVFDSYTEIWSLKKTTGTPPPGLFIGACTSLGTDLYTFGGDDEKSYFNDLHKFDTTTNVWSEVRPKNNEKESPIRKQACGLVSLDERTLVCFGGFGIGPTQPGSAFTKHTPFSDGRGWTNEVHLFDVGKGVWSSPVINGVRPPPCSRFTFTKVDQHRAVIFGGAQPGRGAVNDLYLLDFRNMEFTKVEPVQGEPWPVGRSSHAACCLNYGEGHPKLLMSGGRGNDNKVLGDMWILDVERGKGEKVTIPDSVKPRYYHSTTATSLRPGLTEVLMFGGCLEWSKNEKTWDDFTPVTETTILRFESPDPSPSVVGSSTGEWALVGVANNTDRASNERIREKMIKIGQATRRPTSVREISAESQSLRDCLHSSQDRVRSLEQQLLAAEQRVQDVQQRLSEVSRREQDTQRMLQEANHRCEDVERRATEERERAVNLREENVRLEEQLQLTLTDNQRLQTALEESSAHDIEPWKVSRDKVEVVREIAVGGWGVVSEGKVRVAVKQLHTAILNPRNIERLRREMKILAKIRHPNLVQFIGAVFDDQVQRLQAPPLILTELLDTNLRKAYERNQLPQTNKLPIFVQVCKALVYLHQRHEPIIHRDVSAPNVLLQQTPSGTWKGKLSDLGSANFAQTAQTLGEGAILYSAPETIPSASIPNAPIQRQTTKIDVYSYGVLLCEVITGHLPEAHQYADMLDQVQHSWPSMYELIVSCTKRTPEHRPNMQDILTQLQRTTPRD